MTDQFVSARPKPVADNLVAFPLRYIAEPEATDLDWQLSPPMTSPLVRRCGMCRSFQPLPGVAATGRSIGWCTNPITVAGRDDLVFVHEQQVSCPEYTAIDPDEPPLEVAAPALPQVETAPFALAPTRRYPKHAFFGRWARAFRGSCR